MNNITNIKWNLTVDDIFTQTNKVIDKSKKINDEIINTKSQNKIASLLSNDLNEFNIFHNFCGFLQFVSPNPKLRKAGSAADLLLSKYTNEFNSREDIYMKLLEIKNKMSNSVSDPSDLQFIDKLILNFQRNGINLDDANRQTLLKINHEIAKLENVIVKYISEIENNFIRLTLTQLDGLPISIINTYDKISIDTFNVQFNRINYNLFMKYINDSNVRKYIESSYSTKYDNMLGHLSKLIVLKDKHAKILSYECHSDFKSHIQMTKNSGNIKNFLAELLHKLDFRYKREIDTIMKIMNKSNNYDNLNSWDIQYYITKWKQEYGINDNILKEYFELDNTIKEIFVIYQQLFNIKFIEIDVQNLWCDNIVTYAIRYNNEVIGYLHMDLYSRDGKYKQMRCYCLQPSTLIQIPIICLVASLCIFQNDIVLLNFHEVITLFHEIAHVLHHIIGKTKHSIFSGVNVENDFVEVPAQTLDLLCWEKDIIRRLSKHYKTGKHLEENIIDKLIKVKNLDIGLHYKKHILIALFDQIVYSSDKFIDTCEDMIKNNNVDQLKTFINSLYNQLHNEIMVADNNDFKYKIMLNDNIGLPIEWINTLCESDAQYYSFIWSRVLASDIYCGKIKNQSLDENIGRQLKNKILIHGGTKPAYNMICDYIERKPAIDGFISMHDLDVDMEYSFFLNTDQIKNNNYTTYDDTQNVPLKDRGVQQKKGYIQNDDDCTDSVSNKFSEICEYSVNDQSMPNHF